MISRKLLSGSFVRNVKGCLTAGSSKACTSTSLTTQSRYFGYAAVNHAQEYKEAIDGRHGQQLELAYKESEKYEHGVFDPFEAYKVDVEDDIIVDDGEDSDDEGEEAEPTKYEFNKDGSVKRSKAELVSLKAGAPAGEHRVLRGGGPAAGGGAGGVRRGVGADSPRCLRLLPGLLRRHARPGEP